MLEVLENEQETDGFDEMHPTFKYYIAQVLLNFRIVGSVEMELFVSTEQYQRDWGVFNVKKKMLAHLVSKIGVEDVSYTEIEKLSKQLSSDERRIWERRAHIYILQNWGNEIENAPADSIFNRMLNKKN